MMKIILAFLPLIAFLAVQRFLGPDVALGAAAIIALCMTLTNVFIRRVGAKILDLGSTVLFGGLAAYVYFSSAHLTLAQIRLCADSGLLLIVVISLLIRRPFTLQYASVSAPYGKRMLSVHTVVTGMWAAAFAAMDVADVFWILHPEIPTGRMVAVSAVITVLAFTASRRYVASMKVQATRTPQD
jgi:hypothetical protein